MNNDNRHEAAVLLEEIVLTDGMFDHAAARQQLLNMQRAGEIDLLEYVELTDALNCYAKYGNFDRSRIMQRAMKS